MTALQALKAARDTGVRIGVHGDALTLDAEAAPPAAVLDLLSRHKAQVLALLRPGSDGWSGEALDERGATSAAGKNRPWLFPLHRYELIARAALRDGPSREMVAIKLTSRRIATIAV